MSVLSRVEWIAADVTSVRDMGIFDVWHDRAVFHFLTEAADRKKYVELARRTVPEGGHLIIATFANDGPKRCSGLDVCRYDADSLRAELGPGFALVREASETHTTPWASSQPFFYGVFKRRGCVNCSGSDHLPARSRPDPESPSGRLAEARLVAVRRAIP